jgi:glycogen operon protein
MDYWGYATLAFFAPDRRYASNKAPGGPTAEFVAMVKAMHAVGIKVMLDVVYNHTIEQGTSTTDPTVGSLLSFRGLDNPTYYELTADNQRSFDNTGVGGNINATSEAVRDLVIDSLRYWTDTMGVDGFRFDLAPVLANGCANDCYRFDPGDPRGILARAVAELPARSSDGGAGVELVAEPWTAGGEANTVHLGQFPAGFGEWNGYFRDAVRSAQNRLGVAVISTPNLAVRLGGSSDLYAAAGRTPNASVNFLTCHDGFTHHDLYAFNQKNNTQAWPYGASNGGSDNNLSWDQSGDTNAQAAAARTGLALALVSAGVPMFQGGDEMLRTLNGNNNPYNLDSPANWLDWSRLGSQTAFVAFTKSAIALRAAHAALRPRRFREGIDHDGNGRKDIAFVDAHGADLGGAPPDGSRLVAFVLDGAEAGDGANAIYVAYNFDAAPVTVTLPQPAGAWSFALDTATAPPPAGNAATFVLPARAVVVLLDR